MSQQIRTRRFDNTTGSTSPEHGIDRATRPADLTVSDVVVLLEHGRRGEVWAWGLCRSAAGYWTAYTDGRVGSQGEGAFPVPSGVCEALLEAGWLVPIDVYRSGATLYALAEASEDRPGPPRSGDRPAVGGRASIDVATASPTPRS